jgi:hypothetical protein
MAVDMSDEPASESQHWRNRAKAVRERAKQVKNNRSKRILLGLADTYERVADQIEERLRIMGRALFGPVARTTLVSEKLWMTGISSPNPSMSGDNG